MKFKKLVSGMVATVMLLSSLSVPVSAEIRENIAGSNIYPGSSGYGGKVDWSWSPGRVFNRFGYRISIYYAPQKQDDSSNYVYKDGEPVYDWTQGQPVGRTIDIRQDAMLNNNDDRNTVTAPNQWGFWSVWRYLDNGGAYQYNLDGGEFASLFHENGDVPNNKNYRYYQFTEGDKSSVEDSNNYICALFNDSTLKEGTKSVNNDTNTAVAIESDAIKNKLASIVEMSPDKADVVKETQNKIQDSANYVVSHNTLPLVNAIAEKTNNIDNKEDLKKYMINPTILRLISEACNGKFTAEDFYLGTWDGPDSTDWETKSSEKKMYTRGTYKMIIENMTTTGIGKENGWLCSYTLADSLAMGQISSIATIWDEFSSDSAKLNDYLNGMANSLKLAKADPVLHFGTTDRVMGDRVESFNGANIESDNIDYLLGNPNHFSQDGILGNYSGLAVIDSDSIYSRTNPSTGLLINEISVSKIGVPAGDKGKQNNLMQSTMQISINASDLSSITGNDEIVNKFVGALATEDVASVLSILGVQKYVTGSEEQVTDEYITESGKLTALCNSIRQAKEKYRLGSNGGYTVEDILKIGYTWGTKSDESRNQLKSELEEKYGNAFIESDFYKNVVSNTDSYFGELVDRLHC